jgi:ribosomal-protein-alanine N-acetyltransferase
MPTSLKIRAMREEDVQAVAQLESACFENPWPEKEIEYELKENPCSKILVALIDETVVGYLDFMITFDSATINRLGVTPTERQKGVSQGLLDKMVEFITLEVRAANLPALSLYRKNNWEQITVKKHYYDDGEDAIYMVRSIL